MLARLDAVFFRPVRVSRAQVDALDGVRGLAVLLVVLSHLAHSDLHVVPFLDFRGTGKAGVLLFFVLSAFLLTGPLLDRPRADLLARSTWRVYALRRVLRIYPLYAVVIASAWVLGRLRPGLTPAPLDFTEALRHLTLLDGRSIYWSIPVECKYYVALPLVVVLTAVAARCSGWLAAALLLGGAIGARLAWPGARAAGAGVSLLPHLPVFLLGSLAVVVHGRLRRVAPSPRATLAWQIAAVAALAAAFALAPESWKDLCGETPTCRAIRRDKLLWGMLWSGALLGVVYGRGPLCRVLASKPARLIGIVSFSAYLWHIPVKRLIAPHLPGDRLGACVVLAAILLASCASYALVERPFTSRGGRARLGGEGRPDRAALAGGS